MTQLQETEMKAGARHSKRDRDLLKTVKKSASSIIEAAVELGADEEDVEEAVEDAADKSDEGEAPYKIIESFVDAATDVSEAALSATEHSTEGIKTASLMDRVGKVHDAWNRMYPMPDVGMNAMHGTPLMPYIMDVYDKYAIVCMGDEHYKVGYSVTDAGVEFASRDQWQRVEREWVAKSLKGVRIKSIDETSAVVAGYGLIYAEGVDLQGERFLKDTNFHLDLVPNKPVFYDHTLEEVKHELGTVISVKATDIGLWIEAQLDRSKEYVEAVLKLVERGVLGWSSGSIPHLVRRDGNVIKSWPIVEWSLTPCPAEIRTVGVERVKDIQPQASTPTTIININGVPLQNLGLSVTDTPSTVSVTYPSISFPQTESPQTDTGPVVKSEPIPTQETQPPTTENTPMTTANGASYDDLLAQMKQQQDAVSALLKRFETEPALNRDGFVTMDGGNADKNIKSFADFLLAIRRNDRTRLANVYKAALSGDSGVTGGYLVPDEFNARLLEVASETAIVRPRAFKYPMKTRNATIPVLDQNGTPSGEASAFLAGVVATWTEEAAALTETEPTFELIELTAWKLAGYALASSEIQADSAIGLEALLTRYFGKAIAHYEDYAFLRGSGVAKPLGALVASCAKSVTRATASEFNLVDSAKMLAGLPAGSMGNAVWLMSQSVIPQLVQMDDGTNVVWMANARDEMPMRLHGLPIIFTEKLPALGTARDVALCDFSYYIVADRQPVSIAFSEHFKFSTDQTAWRFTTRVGGMPWLRSALTLNDGTTTVSPFCYLS